MTDAMNLEKIRVSKRFAANKHDTRYTINYEVELRKIIPLYDSERLRLSRRVAIQRELCVEDGLCESSVGKAVCGDLEEVLRQCVGQV